MEEVFGGMSCFAAPPTSSPWLRREIGPPLALFDLAFYRVFFLQNDLEAYRRTMQDVEQSAGRPYFEAHKGWQEVDHSLKTNAGGLLSRLLIPAGKQCALAVADTDALRDLARLALAATAYRARHNKYPEKLDGLLPEFIAGVPTDPFDGKPLQTRRDGQGLVLYSVGRDQKNDDGTPWDPATQEGDIVLRLRPRWEGVRRETIL